MNLFLIIVLVGVAVVVTAWVFASRLTQPDPRDLSIATERPAELTSEWSGVQSNRLQFSVQTVSITAERMRVTLHILNRLRRPVRFLLADKAQLNGSAGWDVIPLDYLTPTGRDERMPTGTGVTLRGGKTMETTLYYPRPKHPHSFWMLYLRWSETEDMKRDEGYVLEGDVAFDLRGGVPGVRPTPVRGVALRQARYAR